MVYLSKLVVAQIIKHQTVRLETNKLCGRRRSFGTVLTFALTDWEKPRENKKDGDKVEV